MSASPDPNARLAEFISQYYDDPLGFVQVAYPWGEPGMLRDFSGPDAWQAEALKAVGEQVRRRRFDGVRPVAPVRMAIASGHGIGKSALSAWLVDWIMSTRPHAQGTITANTYTQLETRTWAAVQKWTRLCITAPWFAISGDRMSHLEHRDTWFCSAQSCKEENSEAFAGQHAATSTSFYLFDEASAVPDAIWEVAEGGLTDGEPMIFAFGNPTRNTGRFYRVTFGSERERWLHKSIDSRSCKLPNKDEIGRWIEEYGEDSDFVRVRVRGLPPAATETQFIDSTRVREAQARDLPVILPDEPLIAGVDVSGGGAAWNVVRFRRGADARSIPAVRVPGEHVRSDRGYFLGRLTEILVDPRHRPAAMFVDSAFGAPYVERLQQLGFRNVFEVNFGAKSPDVHQENMRAYMWNRMKEWLLGGCLPSQDEEIAHQLAVPGFHLNRSDRLVLESKQDMLARGEASPDDADALALTFAQAVMPETAGWPLVHVPLRPDATWMG